MSTSGKPPRSPRRVFLPPGRPGEPLPNKRPTGAPRAEPPPGATERKRKHIDAPRPRDSPPSRPHDSKRISERVDDLQSPAITVRASTGTIKVQGDRRDMILCGVSEFGLLLVELIERDAAFHGAVLTDDDGNPIDYARRPDKISLLDLQITGAQIERCVVALGHSCARFGLSPPLIVIEATCGVLLSQSVCEDYVLAARLGPVTSLHGVVKSFTSTARELTDMLLA
ncbi:MAG: hypothetical protein R3A51_07900 [Nannocystaceae bacterium]